MMTGFHRRQSCRPIVETIARSGRFVVLALLVLAGCRDQESANSSVLKDDTTVSAATNLPQLIPAEYLPNPVRLHDKVISGGLPADEAAFRELQALGIRTIVSVDGARPDIELAKKFGIRYVHLPHGYDGIPPTRVMELAVAVRDLEGPIYIHCHHGRHRSPAAAAVACVTAGMIDASQGSAVLKVARTDPKYLGLFQSVSSACLVDRATLDEFGVQFQEVSQIPPMAEAMVEIGNVFDRLLQMVDDDWKSSSIDADFDPAHEALMLREHFVELLRAGYVADESEEFRAILQDSGEAAGRLEEAFRRWNSKGGSDGKTEAEARTEFSKQVDRISANCAECHRKFRDVPVIQ